MALLVRDEDDHRLEVLHLEDAGERVELLRVATPSGSAGVMFGDVVVLFLMVISAASCRYFLAIRRICAGIVAENSATCLSVGGVRQDRLDVLGEAHLEHLVGLVEHQEPQLG